MWLPVLLLSTAASLIQVDGRPQSPDLSKLPPGRTTVSASREFLARAADGASLVETGGPTGPLATVTDSSAAESFDESAESEQTPPPAEEGDSPFDGDVEEVLDADEFSVTAESSGGEAPSEDSSGEGLDEADRDVELAAVERSTAAPFISTPPPPGPEEAETTAPEPPLAATETVTEAAQETDAPATVPAPAEEEAAATETATEAVEVATEPAPTTGEPASEAAAITTEQPATPTAAAEAEPEVVTSVPEQILATGAEREKADVEEAEVAAQTESDGAVLTAADGEREKTEQLKFAAPLIGKPEARIGGGVPADGAGAGAGEEADDTGAAGRDADGSSAGKEGSVELDDVYTQGLSSQIGQSSVLTDTVKATMEDLFVKPREVAYRLGRHTVNTHVTKLAVTGINDMRILNISSDIDDMTLNVTFQFPKITLTGEFNATGSILDTSRHSLLVLRTPFPSYGGGGIRAVIANTTAVSQAELSHSFNDRKLSIELLTCHLTFGEPQVTLTDVHLPRALRKMHFQRLFRVAIGKMISHQLATEIEPKVDESLHDVITSVLDHVSLDETGAVNFASLGASADAWQNISPGSK